MKTKMRKFGAWLMAAALAFAGAGAVQAAGVAKVGDTEYETIDEALENWGPGKTLTLLQNVERSSTFQVEVNATKSASNWSLRLGDYTWTANGCDAIKLYAAGGTAMAQNYGLQVYANKDGGITASGKNCIKVAYDSSTAGYRPRLEIHGGHYVGSVIVNYASLTWNDNSVSNGSSTWFYAGEDGQAPVFDGNMYLAKCPIYVYSGVFNGSTFNTYPVSSTADTRIYGGKFKSLPSNSNSKVTTYGSNIVFLYDDDGYYNAVDKTKATYEAKLPASVMNSKLTSGNGYTDGYGYYASANTAVSKATSGTTVTLYADATQPKALTSGQSLTVVLENGAKYDAATLITSSTKGYKITPTAVDEKTTKYVCELDLEAAEAKIGDKYYVTANEAVKAAKSGQAITFLRGECTQAKTLKDGERLTLIFVDGKYDYDASVTPDTGCKIEKEMWDSGKTVVLSCAVDPAQCVARIGDTHYTTLAKAVSGAKGGDTIVLERDIDLGSTGVTISKNLTLDLNGHAIAYASGSGRPVYVSGAYVFGLIDSVGTGSVCNSASYGSSNYSVIRAYSGATINISGGAYSSKANLFDIYEKSSFVAASTVNISGGTFAGTLTCGTGSTLSISGGTFDHDPEGFVAEGCMKVKNDDGTWSVCAAGVVAIVGGTPFHSLAEAVEAAADGATVKVVGAATDAATVGKNLVLAIAEGATCASAITVADGKTLTVSDGARFDGKVFANGGTVEFQGLGDKVKGYNEDGSISVKDASGVVATVDDASYFDAGKAVADWAAGTVLTLNAAAEDDAVVSAEKKLVLGEQGRFAGKIVLEDAGKLVIENAVSADNVIRFTGCVAAESLAGVVTAEMPAGFHFASNDDGTWSIFAPGVRAEATTAAAVKDDVTAVDPQGQTVVNPGTEAAAKIETISEKVAESMKADLSESNNEILKGTITDVETGKLDNEILANLRAKAVEVGAATPETVDEVIPETVETDPFAKVSKPLTKVVVEGEKVELDFVAYEVHPVVQKIVGEKTIEVPVSNEKLAESNTYLDFSVPVTVLPEDENEWVLIDHSTDGGQTFKPYDCTKIEKDADGKAKTKTLWSKEFSLWATKTSPTKLVRNLQRSGTAADPFLIRDIDDLGFFRDQVNAGNQEYAGAGVYVKLDADIDLSTIENWEPIGRNAIAENVDAFKGYFDGNGKTISNLKIDSSADRVGLFGNIWNGDNVGWIKDLTVSNATVSSSGQYVGSLIGYGQGYTISNCRIIDGSVSAAEQVGGLGGTLLTCKVEGTTVENVTVTATVDRAGGIAGKVQYGCEIVGNTVKGCTITAANAVSGHDSAAGLVAQVIPRSDGAMDPNTISDNEILGVTTKTAGVDSFTPICNYREGTDYGDDPLSKSTILRNHWDPETTPDETVVHYEGDSVTIPNFHPVAQIEGKGLAGRYESLQAAYGAAQNGDVIKFLTDIELTEGMNINKSIILDFDQHTLTLGANGGIVVYTGSGNTIGDDVTFRNGNLTVRSNSGGNIWGDTNTARHNAFYSQYTKTWRFESVNLVCEEGWPSSTSVEWYNREVFLPGNSSEILFDHCSLTFTSCDRPFYLSANVSFVDSEFTAKNINSQHYVFAQDNGYLTKFTRSHLLVENVKGLCNNFNILLDESSISVTDVKNSCFNTSPTDGLVLTNGSSVVVCDTGDHGLTNGKLVINDGCTVAMTNVNKLAVNCQAGDSIVKAGGTLIVSDSGKGGNYVGFSTTVSGEGNTLTIEEGANVEVSNAIGVGYKGAPSGILNIADGKYASVTNAGTPTGKIELTGGIYTKRPDDAFVSKKAVVVDNIDPETMAAYPYRVERLPDVAQIGDETFVNLNDAYAAVPADGTIKLLADVALTEKIENWAAEHRFTIDLNGKTLTMNSGMSTRSDITLKDGNIAVGDPTGATLGEHSWEKVFYVEKDTKKSIEPTLLFDNVKFVCERADVPTLIQTSARQASVKFNNSEFYVSNCQKPVYIGGNYVTVEFIDTKVVANNVSTRLVPSEGANCYVTFKGGSVEMTDCAGFSDNCNSLTIDGCDISATGLADQFLNNSVMTLKNGAKVVLGDSPKETFVMKNAGLVVEDGCELTISGMPDAAVLSFNKASSVATGAEVSIDSPITASAGLSIAAGAYKSVTASGAVDLTGGIYTVRPLDSYVVNPAYAVFDNDDEATKATHPSRVAAKPEIVEMFNGDGTPFGKTYSLELGFKNVPAGGKILLVGACDESFTTDRIDGFMFQIKEGVIYDVSKITLPNGYALKDNGNGIYSYYKMPIATITHGSEVFEYASLSEACTAAVSGDTIVLSPMIIDAISETAIAGLNNKSVVVKGAGMDATTLNWGTGKKTGPSGAAFGTAEIMFQDLAFTVDHANGEPYKEHFKPMASLAFTGVKVNGMLVVDNDATFDGCKFTGPRYNSKTAADDEYLLWLYKGKLTVVNCTFAGTGTHAPIKLYSEPTMPDNVCALEISNCTFAVVGDQNGAIVSSCKHSTSKWPKDQVYDVQIDTDSITIPDGAYYVGLETSSSAAYGVTIINGTKDKDGKYVSGAAFSSAGTDAEINRIVGLFISADSVCLPYEGPKTNLADFRWYIGPKQVEPKTDNVVVKDEEGNPLPDDPDVESDAEAIKGEVTDTLKGDDIAKFTETGLDDAVVNDDGTMTEDVAKAVKEAAKAQKGGGELTPEEKAAIDALTNEKNRIEIELKAMGMKVETVEESKKVSLSIVKYDVTPKVKVTTVIGEEERIVETVIPNSALVGKPLTFRLAVNDNFGEFAGVKHEGTDGGVAYVEEYITKVIPSSAGKYVELASEKFSTFTVYADITEQPVCKVGDVYYTSIADALEHADDDAVIVLVKDHSEQDIALKETQRIDTDGHTFTGTVESVPTGFDPLLVTDSHGQVFIAPLAYAAVTEPGATNLAVRVKPEFIEGKTAEEVTAWLQETDGNRPRWQNYAMGVSGTAKLTPTAKPAAAGSSLMTITVPEGTTFAPTYKTGVKVSYSLLQYTSPGGAPFKYATKDTPVFEVDVKNIPTKTEWKIQTTFIQEY